MLFQLFRFFSAIFDEWIGASREERSLIVMATGSREFESVSLHLLFVSSTVRFLFESFLLSEASIVSLRRKLRALCRQTTRVLLLNFISSRGRLRDLTNDVIPIECVSVVL